MKKNNNIEMKIYEILGVKIFRKIVFKISDFCLKKLLTKEEQEDFSKNTTNYKMGKVSDLDDIKNYKKQMYFNAIVHIIGTFLGLTTFSYKTGFFNTLFTILNAYCVMLQRYNIIRINKVINKFSLKYEKERNEIKKELNDTDKLLKEHTYKIVDNKNKEKEIIFDELINKSSLSELKKYRECLNYFEKVNDNKVNSFDYPININKILKLQIKK